MTTRKIGQYSIAMLLALALTALAQLSGCKVSKEVSGLATPSVPPGGVLLRGAGATFPSVLYLRWFATYPQQHPNAVITYEAVGSGEGVRRFIGTGVDHDGQIDFGASDAAMRDGEIATILATMAPRNNSASFGAAYRGSCKLFSISRASLKAPTC